MSQKIFNYITSKIDISYNIYELKRFIQLLFGNIVNFLFLQLFLIIIIIYFNAKSSPEFINLIWSLTGINKTHPFYYHTILMGFFIACIILKQIIILDSIPICAIIIYFCFQIISLIYNIFHQLYFGLIPSYFIELKKYYLDVFNKIIRPKIYLVLSSPFIIGFVVLIKDTLEKKDWM